MSLTISQLFNPAPSGVGLNPNAPVASGTWLDLYLTNAALLNLPTTAWQPGGYERTLIACDAVAMAQSDSLVSLMAQGGFLDYAAGGTVTSYSINGDAVTSYVTPDPSIPSQNSTGKLGWLDALTSSFYQVDRLTATYATGTLAIANTNVGTLTYQSGNYHVANTNTGATYTNTAALSIPSSIIAGSGGVVTAVGVGTATTITTTAAHGLSPNDVVYITGVLGVTGLSTPTFATVATVPTTTQFTISVATSGTWTSGGQVYKCTLADMQADVLGVGSNASPGAVTTTVTSNVGVVVQNMTAWGASNYESNAALVARARLKLGSLSPNGPSQAYEYIALTAEQILADQTPAVAMTNGAIIKAITFANPQTEVTTTVVSSTTPASATLGQPVTPGCAQLGITGATNATPIVITTTSAHTLQSNDAVVVSGVLGNTAANGAWTITSLTSNTFSLNNSVGSGAYTGGGYVDGGDLGQVDALIQAKVVPDDTIAVVESSLAFPVTIVATVVVPQAYLVTYQAAAPAALQALIASYPIGGNIPPGGTAGTIPITAVEGALVDAGLLTPGGVSYVRQVTTLTVNGSSTDVSYPAPNYDAQLTTPTITVVGV